MGKRSKFREARRQQAARAVCAVLAAHSQRKTAPVVAATCGDFNPKYRAKIEAYRAFALRAPEDWRCRIKSRSEDRRFIDLVRFAFARYPVPAHLEHVWIEDIDDDFVDDVRARARRAGVPRRGPARPDLLRWYLVATQGGSLHKKAAHPYMSKLETHHFLNAPEQLTSGQAAFWYAVARAQADDEPAARRIAQSRLRDYSVVSTFWKDVARFFARNPTSLQEMNDLIDFFAFAIEADANFSLKGRTLQALRRRMEEWHRALTKQQAIAGGAWAGRAIPDADYEAGSEAKRAIWRFRQIKTGNDLFREGQRMHHCVASYKSLCLQGEVSIWSLSCEYPIGHVGKGVTIEVRRDGAIVQCRGFANRLPHANEVTMVKRWANQYGLTWQALER
jgi:PcfJ-like protein